MKDDQISYLLKFQILPNNQKKKKETLEPIKIILIINKK
jgi:hypothetical protein